MFSSTLSSGQGSLPIIGVHKLVIVHTVGSISLDSFDCRLTTVQSNNIINKRLSGFVQWEGLGWLWRSQWQNPRYVASFIYLDYRNKCLLVSPFRLLTSGCQSSVADVCRTSKFSPGIEACAILRDMIVDGL